MAVDKFSREERAVLAVLAYSAQFSYPLTSAEIVARMLTSDGLQEVDEELAGKRMVWRSRAVADEKVKKTLRSLAKKKVVSEKQNFFVLTSQQRRVTIKKRRDFGKVESQKNPLVEELTTLAARVPWVLGVALTGSYAAGSASAQDDLDFLIVTKKNRLWLTRLILLFYAGLRGRRPHLPGGDISQSWDFNFWLDETRLALPRAKRSVYEAYEILQTRWVFERQNLKKRFFQANPWVGHHLYFWQVPTSKRSRPAKAPIDVVSLFDWLAFFLQVGYRRLRHGLQRADKHSAFFHPAKTRFHIFKIWKKIYQQAIT